MTSKYGKNKKVGHREQPSVSLMFLPHFGVFFDLLLYRPTATWNLFVPYDKKAKCAKISMRLSSNRSSWYKNELKCVYNRVAWYYNREKDYTSVKLELS